jgi:hypothetical protein
MNIIKFDLKLRVTQNIYLYFNHLKYIHTITILLLLKYIYVYVKLD